MMVNKTMEIEVENNKYKLIENYKDAFENDRHDFMCTYSVQCFLNDISDDTFSLKYIVYILVVN